MRMMRTIRREREAKSDIRPQPTPLSAGSLDGAPSPEVGDEVFGRDAGLRTRHLGFSLMQ